jgi:arginine/lysine/ornithine decarboxylase
VASAAGTQLAGAPTVAATAGPAALPQPPQTPFADAVLRLRRDGRYDEQIVSFHALPWSQGRSLPRGPIGDKYEQLFGEAFFATEIAYSGGALDSFFRPTASLDLAQQLAAEAFHADYTFFVTCGTTMSNQIAFDALTQSGGRLMVDRTAHQSLHFAANRCSASVDYAPTTDDLHCGGETLLDVPRMLEMLEAAVAQGRPYTAIALAASSYDGVLYDLHRIFSASLAVSPTTAFLVDEAWAAINTFHPKLRALTALGAAERIAAGGTPITLLVTHSAHKSMSAARQGSYLHVVGDAALLARVGDMLYARHTTSPSIPILASLDLGRAHAQSHGEQLVARSLELAAQVHAAIKRDPALKAYTAPADQLMLPARHWFAEDPTKVLVDVGGLGLTGDEARRRLFEDYDIYVSRTLPHGFLLNMHIGISETDVERMLDALRSLARREYGRLGGARPDLEDGALVEQLVIAYPPGVPVAVPGERWTQRLRDRLAASHGGGAEIYTLPVTHTAAVHNLDYEEAS